MASVKITDNIYSVGVINPNLRIFDIVMKTEFGTTYNSYLVKGSEKTALIECCHDEFFDEYFENIVSVCPDLKIDYIILNHTEPDHSGALRKLIDKIPDITVIASQAGGIYLKNILNESFKFQVAKNGDSLSLGDKTLSFIIAPFLHWPDSMFTVLDDGNVIFTCDFLGAHYCETRVFSSKVRKEKQYLQSFEYYYRAIFGPFKEYVIAGLEKLSPYNPNFICTSHGPVLVGEDIVKAIEKYAVWSKKQISSKKSVAIFYGSAYGCTKKLGEKIAEGIKSQLPDSSIDLFDINAHSLSELCESLSESTAFAIGSPTINKDAVPLIWQLITSVDVLALKGRPALIFGSYGWSGEAIPNMTGRLALVKCKLPVEPVTCIFVPSEDELKKAFDAGVEFAKNI